MTWLASLRGSWKSLTKKVIRLNKDFDNLVTNARNARLLVAIEKVDGIVLKEDISGDNLELIKLFSDYLSELMERLPKEQYPQAKLLLIQNLGRLLNTERLGGDGYKP